MGLTYKEDVADIRESPVENMVQELKEYDANVYGYDSLLTLDEPFIPDNRISLAGDIMPARYSPYLLTQAYVIIY